MENHVRRSRFAPFISTGVLTALMVGGVGALGASAAPSEAAAAPTSGCMVENTTIKITDDAAWPAELSGNLLESLRHDGPENVLFNVGTQGSRHGYIEMGFDVPDQAVAGDSFTVNAEGPVYLPPTNIPDIVDPNGSVIATGSIVAGTDGKQVAYTYTDFVNENKDISSQARLEVGYRGPEEGRFTPGNPYAVSFGFCGSGAKAESTITSGEWSNRSGMRTSWQDQERALVDFVYNTRTTTNVGDIIRFEMDILDAGTQFTQQWFDNDPANSYSNFVEVAGMTWDANKKMMTGGYKLQKVAGQPAPGQFRLTLSNNKLVVEANVAQAGESLRLFFRTEPDGTSAWKGTQKIDLTVKETINGKVTSEFERQVQPPNASGSGEGTELTYTDPVLTKSMGDGGFVLTLTNPSTKDYIRPIVLQDSFYRELKLTDQQLSITNPSVGTVSGNTWSLPLLGPGDTATAFVPYTEPRGGYQLTNRFGPEGSECVTGDLSGALGPLCAEVKIPPLTAKFTAEKIATLSDDNGNGTGDVGEKIAYSFTVKNTGESQLSDVKVDDPMIGKVVCERTTLAPNASTVCKAENQHTVVSEDIVNGEVKNVATVTVKTIEGISSLTPIVVNAVVPTSEPAPSIQLIKEATLEDTNESGVGDFGENIEYSFTVTNTGNVDLVDLELLDPMIEKMPSLTGKVLAPGEAVTVVADEKVVIDDSHVLAEKVENTATVNGVGVDTAATTVTDESTAVVDVARPVFDITKSDNRDTAKVGDELTYVITVTNSSDSPAHQVPVKDMLPDGVSYRSSDPAAQVDGQTLSWVIEDLAAGQSVELTVKAEVGPELEGKTVTNTASIQTDWMEKPLEGSDDTTIDNEPVAAMLPDTGANGLTWMAIIAASLLLAGSVALIVMQQRRAKERNAA